MKPNVSCLFTDFDVDVLYTPTMTGLPPMISVVGVIVVVVLSAVRFSS